MSIKIFCLFYNWIVWGFVVVVELYEIFICLDISPLSVSPIQYVTFHFVGGCLCYAFIWYSLTCLFLQLLFLLLVSFKNHH